MQPTVGENCTTMCMCVLWSLFVTPAALLQLSTNGIPTGKKRFQKAGTTGPTYNNLTPYQTLLGITVCQSLNPHFNG